VLSPVTLTLRYVCLRVASGDLDVGASGVSGTCVFNALRNLESSFVALSPIPKSGRRLFISGTA
jgi:hypothetical protein